VLLALHAIRQSQNLNGDYSAFLVEQYVLRNLVAFDTLQPFSSEHWGENVFRIFYAVSNRLGISSVEPVDTILPWIYKPVCTNTYTCMYPFFKDFGYWGIALFAPVLGGLTGWVYKRRQQGDVFFSMLYAYFSTMLVFEFDGELFFTNLAGNIKFILLLSLPFLFGGYKKTEE
jgi:oligosaccharide repeat unit polymerase